MIGSIIRSVGFFTVDNGFPFFCNRITALVMRRIVGKDIPVIGIRIRGVPPDIINATDILRWVFYFPFHILISFCPTISIV